MKQDHVCLQNRSWGCDSSTACQSSRRCPFADVFEHFELIEKVNGDLHEIVGVKCRLCDEIILDEATARELLAIGAWSAEDQKQDPVLGAMALLTLPLLVNGGLHMLACTRRKMN